MCKGEGEVARQQLFLAGLAVKLLLLVGAGLATRLCLFGSSTPLPEGEPYEGPSPAPQFLAKPGVLRIVVGLSSFVQ